MCGSCSVLWMLFVSKWFYGGMVSQWLVADGPHSAAFSALWSFQKIFKKSVLSFGVVNIMMHMCPLIFQYFQFKINFSIKRLFLSLASISAH